jgi:hypothetical protein
LLCRVFGSSVHISKKQRYLQLFDLPSALPLYL